MYTSVLFTISFSICFCFFFSLAFPFVLTLLYRVCTFSLTWTLCWFPTVQQIFWCLRNEAEKNELKKTFFSKSNCSLKMKCGKQKIKTVQTSAVHYLSGSHNFHTRTWKKMWRFLFFHICHIYNCVVCLIGFGMSIIFHIAFSTNEQLLRLHFLCFYLHVKHLIRTKYRDKQMCPIQLFQKLKWNHENIVRRRITIALN